MKLPKIIIRPDDVLEQFSCPFCGDKLSVERNACCGEAGHGETMYATETDSSWMTHDEFFSMYFVNDKNDKAEPCPECNRFGPNCHCEPESQSDR